MIESAALPVIHSSTIMTSSLSSRGHYNLDHVLNRIPRSIIDPSPRDKTIDLSMAENHLIRADLMEIIRQSVTKSLHFEHLDWPKGLWGDLELLDHMTSLFNNRFGPHPTVRRENIAITPGAAAALDAMLYTICDAGDGVLVPIPYWGGYDAFFQSHSAVVPVEVNTSSFEDALGPALINALEIAYHASRRRIRGMILCNPHNPLGRCYSEEVLKSCASFCRRYNLHLISDEVFAMSSFNSADSQVSFQFKSILSLDLVQFECDPEYFHTIWSMSKDLGVSGMRLGCVVTRNQTVRDSIALLATANVSTLSTIASKDILSSPELPNLLDRNSERLAKSYEVVTSFFVSHNIQYFPCNSALFVCAKLAPYAKSLPEELAALHQYTEAGVLVAPGVAYHMPEHYRGWMRVSFAVSQSLLAEGLARIASVYSSLNIA